MKTLTNIREILDISRQAVYKRIKKIKNLSIVYSIDRERIFTDEEAGKIINYNAERSRRKRKI